MIPYGRQDITDADIEAVRNVLLQRFHHAGPGFPRSRTLVAEVCGAAHAVAVNSATSALHIACARTRSWSRRLALDLPEHFRGLGQLRRYCGASVRFRRYRPANLQPCTEALERNWSWRSAKAACRRSSCRCILPGNPARCSASRSGPDLRVPDHRGRQPRDRRLVRQGPGRLAAGIRTSRSSASIRSRLSRPAKAAWR